MNILKIIGYLLMMIAGIVLYVLTCPAYGVAVIIGYYISGIIGNISGIIIKSKKEYGFIKAFLLSIVITLFVITIFTLFEGLFKGGLSAISGFLEWFAILMLVLTYKAFAITMTVFPITILCFYIYRKNK